jgi:alpha-aminoadipate carrier protein LysW
MVTCPECEAALDVEEEELDEGDQLTCEECGVTLTVASVDPIELEADDEDEEEDEDFDYDDDEDDDEEEEDEWK